MTCALLDLITGKYPNNNFQVIGRTEFGIPAHARDRNCDKSVTSSSNTIRFNFANLGSLSLNSTFNPFSCSLFVAFVVVNGFTDFEVEDFQLIKYQLLIH